MSTQKEHSAASKKLLTGPGGFKCRCCNPFWMSPRKAKKKASRHARRTAKHKFHAQEAY